MALKTIYLAGGCFWGLQKYMDAEVKGVILTETGYANGKGDHATYEEVCFLKTGFAETVKVVYDPSATTLKNILKEYYYTIDPTSINRQGADRGDQYRTGIYYVDEDDLPIIENSLKELQRGYKEKIAIEYGPLKKFIPAEEYHQKYLDKNPGGYCHINFQKIRDIKAAIVDPSLYTKKSREELEKLLDPLQYAVTQGYEDEEAFSGNFLNNTRDGIYTDITTGEPLFCSSDICSSDSNYLTFKKPIDPNVIKEIPGIQDPGLTLAISRAGLSYLGHIYVDEKTGEKTYGINSAALSFIPKEEMDERGYGYLKDHLKF